MKFSNTYAQLGNAFYQRVMPTPASRPSMLLWNEALADSLQLEDSLNNDAHLAAEIFSGSKIPDGADPMALAYSGHQFGHLNPQLGDGRAHLLGEVINDKQQRVDIQLKGSGRTPYSRQGDGRCALGPAIREYLMSEAMSALGVPTSRVLAVVSTGDTVARKGIEAGAVVTRVAASHIRIGTFVYFAIRKDTASLAALLDHSIDRHFPDIDKDADDKVLVFLRAAMEKQITLVVEWMRVGFIHGVMNTDNVAISGETIDFGPCAMMGNYDPATVFSSIDTQGRYAFGNQPNICLWNMARLAEALLPLISDDEKAAVAAVEPVLNDFTPLFQQAYFQMLANKLGIETVSENSSGLAINLLEKMQEESLDYTNTFIKLTQSLSEASPAEELGEVLGEWYSHWRQALNEGDNSETQAKALMQRSNPLVIPRNHHVEAIIKEAEDKDHAQAAVEFLKVLRSPYQMLSDTARYQDEGGEGDKHYQTFCGT